MRSHPTPGPVVLNGRVSLRSTVTGVERWTNELMPRLKAIAPERYAVLTPGANLAGRKGGHVWEQLILPARAERLGASLVLSPANLAPWFWPNNVVVVHDAAVLRHPEAYSWRYRFLHRSFGIGCARRAIKVITVSEFSRRELIELAGLQPEAVAVIHNGVDQRFCPGVNGGAIASKHGLEAPYVLTVATNDARKNLASLAHAARVLDEHGIVLAWAGGALPNFTARDRPNGVVRLGYVNDQDLVGLYRGAVAFVLPSRYEGFGLTCLEAMACGTPVVAAASGALPETCGDAALLVDADDPREIAEALVSVASDDSLRAKLAERGIRRARELTWDRAARDVHEVLSTLRL